MRGGAGSLDKRKAEKMIENGRGEDGGGKGGGGSECKGVERQKGPLDAPCGTGPWSYQAKRG